MNGISLLTFTDISTRHNLENEANTNIEIQEVLDQLQRPIQV